MSLISLTLVVLLNVAFLYSASGLFCQNYEQYKGLTGGWIHNGPDELQSNGDARQEEISDVANNMMNAYNKKHDAELEFSKVNHVYYQIVAGTNYCIEFDAESPECANEINKDLCISTYHCGGKAFQPLPYEKKGPEVSNINCWKDEDQNMKLIM